ncbi:hypothetical protein C8Q79DRAFT_911239 [Trametes meyenii]|nr:hypothetical protein C8Q79DRAFT_911239 [Trametes meyenii]
MDLQGSVRVDGQTYLWTGMDTPAVGDHSANTTHTRITPTRSIFTMQAGPMNLTITYLSPIEPSDWTLQSLPFSYVSFEASTLDGQAHDVQVYSELTAEWLSSDVPNWLNIPVQWSQRSTTDGIFFEIQFQSPQKFVEVDRLAQDGIAYFAAAASPQGLTWQIDSDVNCRGQFHDHGKLLNTSVVGTSSRGILPVNVFSIAHDLGEIQNMSSPVTWALGHVRNPTILYSPIPGSVARELSPYFITHYGSNMAQAVNDITEGFSAMLQRAIAFDEAIVGNASKISPEYADLVSLAARQTMASLDITVSTSNGGQPNSSDVRIFMKDNGATTPTSRVNPVERIYAALPMMLYLNASLVGPILVPLLEAQDGSTIQQSYAAPDLGVAYPNATGARNDPNLGIEQSGNMLILLYAHARFTGDGSLISQYYNLAKRWADFLVNNTLIPGENQVSADSEIVNAANMTNLAIKGIIGGYAASLAASWLSLALSTNQSHLLGVYGDQGSWALLYNLYADRLLGTNVVSEAVCRVLRSQTSFYKSLLASGIHSTISYAAPAFGLPITSSSGVTSAAWLLFTAAIVSDDDVRDSLIQSVWNRASFNQTQGALPDAYDVRTGIIPGDSAGG